MEKRIFEGEVLEVETVEIFKDIVGERAPKEEKKDAKKKWRSIDLFFIWVRY